MIEGDYYSPRLKDQRAAVDADQVEAASIKSGVEVFDTGLRDERISGTLEEIDAEESGELNRLEAADLAIDTVSGKVAKEILRRKEIMGDAYPFKVERNSISYVPSKSGVYEFCLAACLSDTITEGKYVEFPRKFERIAAELVKTFYGKNARSLHVGAPRDPVVGANFQKGMETLSREAGEWVWSPEDGLPEEAAKGGDEGVDFVVWIPMPDKRPGSFFLLAQCACGDDWTAKWHDLSVRKLEKWFQPMTRVEPMRAFAAPHQIVDGMLIEATRDAGLVFDRARLTIIAERLSEEGQRQALFGVLRPISEYVITYPAAAE